MYLYGLFHILQVCWLILWDLLLLLGRMALACLEAAFRILIPLPLKSLDKELVLVTGAAHGIGRELALQLGVMGATVVCWDVQKEENEQTAEMVLERGGKAHAYQCDVANREQVFTTGVLVQEEVGDVTMLVNNAAVLSYGSMLHQDFQEIKKTFDINVLAHFWVLEMFLPAMVRQRHGHVVALSSMSGLAGSPNMSAYSSSKFAVRGLMESLREELRLDPRNLDIPCTCIFPFYVDTGMATDPKFRFPWLFRAMSVEDAAREILRAVQTDTAELSLPGVLLLANSLYRVLPHKVLQIVVDFLRNEEGARKFV